MVISMNFQWNVYLTKFDVLIRSGMCTIESSHLICALFRISVSSLSLFRIVALIRTVSSLASKISLVPRPLLLEVKGLVTGAFSWLC